MCKILSFICLSFLIAFSNATFAQTADIYQKAGDGYMADKNYQAAYDSYTQAIKKTSNEKPVLYFLYFKRAQSLNGLQKTDDALLDYNHSIVLNPFFAGTYWNRGIIYNNSRRYNLAITDYRKAISLLTGPGQDKNLSILYCNIAFGESELMNYPAAMADDSTAITLNEQNSDAYKIRGKIHSAIKKFDLAIDDYTQAIYNAKADNNTMSVSYLFSDRADNKRYLKKYREAISDYTIAIQLNPKNREAYWNKAAAYYGNTDFKLAADYYTEAMAFYQDDNYNLSKLYQDRATNEIGQTLFSLAIKDDSIALRLDSTNKDAYFSLGVAYTQNADYQKGIDAYNKLMTFYNSEKKLLAILHYQVANNEYFLNQFDKVIDDCSKAITLNPEFSASYYYRGKVYLKKMGNKSMAYNDFNKVISLDTTKKTVDYIFSLYYSGKAEEATTILQDEILITTNSASLLSDYYNMACLFSLMNKPDEANNYLKKAIDSGYAKKYAAADEDLDNIRNTDDYKSIMTGPSNQ